MFLQETLGPMDTINMESITLPVLRKELFRGSKLAPQGRPPKYRHMANLPNRKERKPKRPQSLSENILLNRRNCFAFAIPCTSEFLYVLFRCFPKLCTALLPLHILGMLFSTSYLDTISQTILH